MVGVSLGARGLPLDKMLAEEVVSGGPRTVVGVLGDPGRQQRFRGVFVEEGAGTGVTVGTGWRGAWKSAVGGSFVGGS